MTDDRSPRAREPEERPLAPGGSLRRDGSARGMGPVLTPLPLLLLLPLLLMPLLLELILPTLLLAPPFDRAPWVAFGADSEEDPLLP